MESLALLVTVIISIALLGGPLSLLFSFLYKRRSPSHLRKKKMQQSIYRWLAIILALPAILVGLRLITLDLGLGGVLIGLVGALTGGLAIYRTLKS